jgi:hypothetical protein
VREREDTNRTRVAGNRDEVEGVVASTLSLFRNGASLLAKAFGVGLVDRLDDFVEGVKDCLRSLLIVACGWAAESGTCPIQKPWSGHFSIFRMSTEIRR